MTKERLDCDCLLEIYPVFAPKDQIHWVLTRVVQLLARQEPISVCTQTSLFLWRVRLSTWLVVGCENVVRSLCIVGETLSFVQTCEQGLSTCLAPFPIYSPALSFDSLLPRLPWVQDCLQRHEGCRAEHQGPSAAAICTCYKGPWSCDGHVIVV